MNRRIWAILLVGILSVTVLGITLFAQRANAPTYAYIWTAVASTAAIDESSLGKYSTSGGILSFKSGQAGTIQARINVLEGDWTYIGEATTLQVTFYDPDGTGTRYRVEVALYRCLMTNGASYLIRSINSNSYAKTSGYQTRTVWFQHSFDFLNNAYYIQITLYRYYLTYSPLVSRVALWYTIL